MAKRTIATHRNCLLVARCRGAIILLLVVGILLLTNPTWSEAAVEEVSNSCGWSIPGSAPWAAAFIISFLALLSIARDEIRDLARRPTELAFRGASVKFDKAVEDAFAKAANSALARPLNRSDHDFSDEDFEAAMQLDDMTNDRNRKRVYRLVRYLVERYEKVHREPRSEERTRRRSAIIAQMRLLAFAARPMLKELIKGGSIGERVAAIAFLQAKPSYDAEVLDWLASRLSPGAEWAFVQYNALKALLATCTGCEANDRNTVQKTTQKAKQNFDKMRPDRRTERGDILQTCAEALGE